MVDDIAKAINEYGFPIIAAMGMGYFIYFIWKWVTEEIDPIIGETMGTLIKLVDRVRMLDNDMIRMNTKLAMVLEHKVMLDSQLDDEQKEEMDLIISKYQSQSKKFDSTGKAPAKAPEKAPVSPEPEQKVKRKDEE
jgi:hypothetical protein